MDEVRRLRKLKGLTQVELAELAGVSAYTITEIETGHREPRPSTLRKLASALDAEVADFFPKASAPSRDVRDGAILRNPFNARTAELYGAPDERQTEEQRRRERTYGPLSDYTNRLLERWENKAASGRFDRGEAAEFDATLKLLAPYLAEMEAWELADTPPEERGENNENLILNRAIWRLINLLPNLKAAYDAKLEGSELEQAKRRLESFSESLYNTVERGTG